jgi:hypothetical protein
MQRDIAHLLQKFREEKKADNNLRSTPAAEAVSKKSLQGCYKRLPSRARQEALAWHQPDFPLPHGRGSEI